MEKLKLYHINAKHHQSRERSERASSGSCLCFCRSSPSSEDANSTKKKGISETHFPIIGAEQIILGRRREKSYLQSRGASPTLLLFIYSPRSIIASSQWRFPSSHFGSGQDSSRARNNKSERAIDAMRNILIGTTQRNGFEWVINNAFRCLLIWNGKKSIDFPFAHVLMFP